MGEIRVSSSPTPLPHHPAHLPTKIKKIKSLVRNRHGWFSRFSGGEELWRLGGGGGALQCPLHIVYLSMSKVAMANRVDSEGVLGVTRWCLIPGRPCSGQREAVSC